MNPTGVRPPEHSFMAFMLFMVNALAVLGSLSSAKATAAR